MKLQTEKLFELLLPPVLNPKSDDRATIVIITTMIVNVIISFFQDFLLLVPTFREHRYLKC